MEVDDMYTENEQEEVEAVDIVSPESIQHWTQKFPPYTNNCLTTMTFIQGYWLFWGHCVFLLQGCNQVVDTTALVRSCVQSAVGMLRDQVESDSRSTQRVDILLTLLSDDDEIKGANDRIVVFYCCCIRCIAHQVI